MNKLQRFNVDNFWFDNSYHVCVLLDELWRNIKRLTSVDSEICLMVKSCGFDCKIKIGEILSVIHLGKKEGEVISTLNSVNNLLNIIVLSSKINK